MSGADWNVYIAKYKQDKACAISYTFDDGLAEHYTLVAPQLEKRGFRGTFWICGSKINKDSETISDTTRMTWPQLREMSDNGHEISNHGWAHKNFARFPIEEIKEDIINVIPCMMPYVDAQFQPRKMSDRPNVVPKGSTNFAMISQFVEIPEDMVFTEEYSVRAARIAVYKLLGINKPICKVTPYNKDPKVLKKALETAYR